MLTAEQEEAAKCEERLFKIEAGAGSGKTTVMVERILHLLSHGVPPQCIMAITFTRKAAGEIRDRLGTAGRLVNVGTFHSAILKVARDNGINRHPIDEDEANEVLDASAINIGIATRTGGNVKYHKKSRAHYRRMVDAYYGRETGANADTLVETYLTKLAIGGDIDYEGTLGLALDMIDRGMFARYEHVLVDEAQDNSPLQWKIVHGLANSGMNVVVCGDTAQSMYSFRGAVPWHMDALDWPVRQVRQTFRVPVNFAELVNRFPVGNIRLVSEKDPGDFHAMRMPSCVEIVQSLLREGHATEDIAILCRYNATVEAERDALESAGILTSKPISEEDRHIHNLLMYLGNMSSRAARRKASASPGTGKPWSWIKSELSDELARSLTANWMNSIGNSVYSIIDNIEKPGMLRESRAILAEYGGETVDSYYSDCVFERFGELATPGITVDTVHAAKGREWPIVIVSGLSEWPRKINDEEWRIFYVAITRSMQSLYLLWQEEQGEFARFAVSNIGG